MLATALWTEENAVHFCEQKGLPHNPVKSTNGTMVGAVLNQCAELIINSYQVTCGLRD